jgi:hypothetical protein
MLVKLQNTQHHEEAVLADVPFRCIRAAALWILADHNIVHVSCCPQHHKLLTSTTLAARWLQNFPVNEKEPVTDACRWYQHALRTSRISSGNEYKNMHRQMRHAADRKQTPKKLVQGCTHGVAMYSTLQCKIFKQVCTRGKLTMHCHPTNDVVPAPRDKARSILSTSFRLGRLRYLTGAPDAVHRFSFSASRLDAATF